MKKLLILVLLSLSFWTTYASYWIEKVVETAKEIPTKYDYYKAEKLYKEVSDSVNKYYYNIVFEKWNKDSDYKTIEKKLNEYNKYRKLNSYYKYSQEAKVSDIINNVNTQEIINTLWYHTISYNRYDDYSNNNSLFIKEYNISDIKNIKLNDKIDWIYLWLKFDKINIENRYDKRNNNKYLKNIYTKYDNKNWIAFKKIDLEKFDWKIKININKFVKEINKDEIYWISFNFYIKKWDNYIKLIKYNINSTFTFDKYSITRALERKYMEETNPNEVYYRNSSINTKLDEVLNEKLKTIFEKIKNKKTNWEYLAFLENVKSKIIKFTKDREKYTKLVEEVKDEKSFQNAFSKFKKYKKQEKIVNILLVFISNEIYQNTLEDTIKDFIK